MLTSHELFGFMSPGLAGEILESAYTHDKPLYRGTLAAVAEARKVRPVFLERQPRQERHPAMLASLTRPSLELAAANLIRGWLLKEQAPLLVQFLDALGIKHEKGVVEDLPPAVEDDKLKAAVDALLAVHRHEVVAVYLIAFNEMNQANWPNLKVLLDSDPRLQLGAHS